MDIATILGFLLGVGLVIFGSLVAGLSAGDLIDIPSVLITFGGGLSATVMGNPLYLLTTIPKYARFAIFEKKANIAQMITRLVNYSERARREGLLSLEDDLANVDEPFLKKGLQLVVDGTDPELVRNILETDMSNIHARHEANAKFFGLMGVYLPAFGMLGTLIGLIQMLKNLGTGDTSAIGAGMAAALITTLYGSFGSNLIAMPIKDKLLRRDQDEMLEKAVMIEGILSIQSGDNPRIVKDKLASFLPPSDRAALDEAVGGG
ncbi:MAG: motility protein A [Leptonema illini]|jgi:chemotaxis protein MotA|uniref:MotA/TolQ/ExbB proton channel n=2 Tax=Leptonema illini TaxID=183 RepID=H2CJV9_9LEPT|nr:motility protein A [Leptonema illini]EHQ05023.1 MotA/TolQ/ExbB proton channel [Leptonema illini DSM 21528]KAB2929193.1 MAG: motility protein A [Leptonema illini]